MLIIKAIATRVRVNYARESAVLHVRPLSLVTSISSISFSLSPTVSNLFPQLKPTLVVVYACFEDRVPVHISQFHLSLSIVSISDKLSHRFSTPFRQSFTGRRAFPSMFLFSFLSLLSFHRLSDTTNFLLLSDLRWLRSVYVSQVTKERRRGKQVARLD